MTNADLMQLVLAAILKGAAFGLFFSWAFPRFNTWLMRRMGRDPGPLQHVPFGGSLYFGMALLSGSGFALLDLIGAVSDSAGLPEMLRWVVMVLFGAVAAGGSITANATPRPPVTPPA